MSSKYPPIDSLLFLLRSLNEAELGRLAQASGAQAIYLKQIAWGHRRPSPRLTQAIERETQGRVTRYMLRPDIYGDDPNAQPGAA